MDSQQTLRLMKALADGSRLSILETLLGGPRYVEELAERLALAPSTVSFHLKKLEQAGLVTGRKEQYYVVYRAEDQVLDRTLRQLVSKPEADRRAEEERMDAYREKVLKTFIKDGRVERLPAQYKKRLIVLEACAEDLEPGREYEEAEVNDLIHRRYHDHCLLRREMVDAGFVTREGGVYRRGAVEEEPAEVPLPPGPTRPATEDDVNKTRKELIREYKLTEKTAGLYQVRNLKTGKILLGSAMNLHGPLNKHRLELQLGSHKCGELQKDWNALGPDAFAFEIVEEVESDGSPTFDTKGALEALEEKWIEQLSPFTKRCYNTNERIRSTPF